jgi:acetylornithine deacetylase/succinyl-diaminopimelate desuccinylase-like protein
MRAIATNPKDKAAEAVLSQDRAFHAMLRRTCVATLLDGGHANNALPQRAGANVNCRILPGHSIEGLRQQLEQVVADKGVSITAVPPMRPVASSPPLDPKVIGPMEQLAARYFPGVPVVPTMNTGGTDAIFLSAVGIPTYGVPGAWYNPDGNGAHGLNERIEVQSLLTGRAYLYDLVKAYTK